MEGHGDSVNVYDTLYLNDNIFYGAIHPKQDQHLQEQRQVTSIAQAKF